MAINRGNISKELIPGLNAIFGTAYGQIDNEHLPLFEVERSNRSFEEEVMFAGLPAAPEKTEGSPVSYEDMQETYKATYNHVTIALGFAITEEAVEDNLYPELSKQKAKALGRSLATTKQVRAADVFNTGFSKTRGDGVSFFSSSHPTITGDQSNIPSSPSDLSETSLEQAVIDIADFKDERGIFINARPVSLHIPSELRFTAYQILKSELSTTTATVSGGVTNVNDVNALRSMGLFPKGTFINHRFTDADAWFIKTDVPNGTKHFVRIPLQTGEEGDFDTGNYRYKARERYSFGVSDWRSFYGTAGAG